ncbi:hypothetical protein ACWGI0_05745 [Streptomyces sp. NPDC054802]
MTVFPEARNSREPPQVPPAERVVGALDVRAPKLPDLLTGPDWLALWLLGP